MVAEGEDCFSIACGNQNQSANGERSMGAGQSDQGFHWQAIMDRLLQAMVRRSIIWL